MKKPISRILVTGASGLVGSHLLRRLGGLYEITALSRHPRRLFDFTVSSWVVLDMSDLQTWDRFLGMSSFDAVINCAAMTDVDACEAAREEADRLNTASVSSLARFCLQAGCLLIQLSTDYIFDGTAGPYPEEATPYPINHYGLTKLRAEEAITASGSEYVIVRTNYIYGAGADGPGKSIGLMLESNRRNRPVFAADDQYCNPTWAGNLADAIVEILTGDFRGVINVGGADYISRYDFALMVAGIFKLDGNLIVRKRLQEMNMAAPRPLKAGLTIERMRTLLKTQPVAPNEGLLKVNDGAT